MKSYRISFVDPKTKETKYEFCRAIHIKAAMDYLMTKHDIKIEDVEEVCETVSLI